MAPEYDAACERVRRAMIEFYESPGLEQRRAAAVERTAIEEIKAALLKYRHLDDHVLRTAFMEFVAQDVLES